MTSIHFIDVWSRQKSNEIQQISQEIEFRFTFEFSLKFHPNSRFTPPLSSRLKHKNPERRKINKFSASRKKWNFRKFWRRRSQKTHKFFNSINKEYLCELSKRIKDESFVISSSLFSSFIYSQIFIVVQLFMHPRDDFRGRVERRVMRTFGNDSDYWEKLSAIT